MGLLYFLESIRVPGLNEFMLAVTYLGDEIAFLVTALILFWCVDKRQGYYILSVGFVGTIANQFLKLWFRIPRPWVQDPNFTILEQAREAATGYSFPSGHTQSGVGTFGGIAHTTKNKVIRILSIVIAVLVPLSRMYIGVHTPLDVIVAAAIAVVLILVIQPVIFRHNGKYIPWLLGIMTVLAVAYLCFVELYPFPADVDAYNLAHGQQNAYTFLGALTGLLVVYLVDEKWLKFPTSAIWWAQLLKIVIGLGLVLLIKSGLKTPLNALFGELTGRAVRYFLMVVMAGIIWPLSFKYFAKTKSKE